jgi:hypothetical protein
VATLLIVALAGLASLAMVIPKEAKPQYHAPSILSVLR